MKLIGLTGSIGSGKTTIARMFADLGVPVFCSDNAVHELLKPEGAAFAAVATLFPQAVIKGRIDRKKLGQLVFGNIDKLRRLEKIVHPMVEKQQRDFINNWRRQRKKMVVLDIPLLFEIGAENRFDVVVTVWAPPLVQKQRVLARSGMTEQKFHAIIKRQMPVAEKIKRADIAIASGLGRWESRKIVKRLVGSLA